MTKPKKEELGAGAPSVSSADFSTMSKMSKKELGKHMAQETPDQSDIDNIERIIKVYERSHPGVIRRLSDDARTEVALSNMNSDARVMADWQRAFWLPGKAYESDFGLDEWMEKAYPSLWHNKKHAEWFMKNFPQFTYVTHAKELKQR